jgi:polar amino acid transport system substrate-binding protein
VRVGFILALAALVGAAGVEAGQHEGVDAVRHRGYLRICADPANPPYSSDVPASPGFEVELARLIARELGVSPRMEWHTTLVRALKPLRDGACDIFMGLPRDARFRDGNPWIAVTRPYYVMRHALVVKTETGVTSLADLTGRRVAVELASIAEGHVGYTDVQRGLYRTQGDAFGAVVDGSAAAAVLWQPVAVWLARNHPELRVVPMSGPGLDYAIGAGVRRRDPGLAEAVDTAMGRLLESGEAQEILTRYGVGPARAAAGDDVIRVQARDPIEVGRSIFSTACSRCHGAEGVGGGTNGAIPKLRHYDGGQEKFIRITNAGRKNTAMAGFKGILTDEEIAAVYQYLMSLPAN